MRLQGDLTLEKAVTIARQQEQIKHQIKEQNKQLEQLDIEEACRHGHCNNRERTDPRADSRAVSVVHDGCLLL